jgi:AraC family transcriptional regulator, regulatory protein of adaptative response / DNA-3-methyladenine glycosylase II
VDFEALYLAVESRDARFDGRVFVGVLSTGVYCRPVCPAPMPRRDRVRFFPAAAAAEEAGFRACRRCRPEAFAAGFASLRAYNAEVLRSYGRPPVEIRRAPRRADERPPGGPGLRLRLAYRPPFAGAALLAFLAHRAVPGVEAVEGGTFRRSLRTADGRPVVIGLTPAPGSNHVVLEVAVQEVPELAGVVQAARRLLDLDADPAAIDRVLGADPALLPSVRRTPGVRLPGSVDPFELAVRAVLGQSVSVPAARTLAGRLVLRHGTPLERPTGAVTHLFPGPERLAEAALDDVGLTAARAGALRRLAELVALGKLDLSGAGDPAEAIRMLDDVPGIGPWTCAYVAMRGLRDPDAFPAADLGVRRGFEALGLPASPAAVRDRAERWRPWRAYAVLHLWNAAAA